MNGMFNTAALPGALPAPPPNSALNTLWLEWLTSTGHIESPLEMTLSGSESSNLPLTSAEMSLEAKKASFRLMGFANERLQSHRGEEGTLTSADAKAFIYTSSNRMVAWMVIFPPIGDGNHATWEMLKTAQEQHLITSGVNETTLQYVAAAQLYFQMIPFAVGSKPENGVPGYLEEYYPHTAVIEEPDDDSDEILPPPRAGYVQNISAGEVICRLFPPKPGVPGMDVFGSPLPCVPGTPASLTSGQNTTLNENGELVADIDGALFYERNRFYVRPLYISSGHVVSGTHIDFDGDIEIMGDVLENCVIHATGSISIKGLVEASLITAGKDIFIDGGILGDNRAVLRAKGKVHAKYLEYCVVYAGEDVRVGDVISSQLYSDGKVEVRGGRGTIIGGCVVAPYEVYARVMGSRAECATEIRLGEFPCVALRQEEFDEQMESIRMDVEHLDSIIAQMEGDLTTTQKIPLVKARLRRSSLEMRINQLTEEKEALKPFCEDYSKCKMRADTIYPEVSITIGAYTYTVEERHRNCTATLKNEDIEVKWFGL